MLTIRAAATLLARIESLDSMRPLLRELGFTSPPHVIDAALRQSLGLDDCIRSARLLAGPGPLRALAGVIADDADPRDATRRLATALDRHAPGTAWLLCLLHAPAPSARTALIATVRRAPAGQLRLAVLRSRLAHVTDSDADTVRALAAAATAASPTAHHDALDTYTRWTDVLGREALSGRFYRALEHTVQQLADTAGNADTVPPGERRTLALLTTSRLLFLAFLEAKGWLDDDRGFLMRECTAALERGGRLHQRWLQPLAFGTLNTPVPQRAPAARRFGRVPFLNGGLFARAPIERAHARLRFHDDAIVALVGNLLDRYRFTASEDSATWSEAAVDPEMLGRAFEGLMAPVERRSSGSFYTPPALVERVVADALHHVLPPTLAPAARRDALDRLRCLDPACGSGAFLVHTLERLTALRIAAGDTRPAHTVRRDVLTTSIFGVDRNPIAVWLCELRLWLAVIIDCDLPDPMQVPPLPNLDHHIRLGDSLAGGDFRFAPTAGRRLATLRARYTNASGTRKLTLAHALDREERARARAELARIIRFDHAERTALLARLRTRDLFGDRPAPSAIDRARLVTLRTRLRELRARDRRLALGGALPFRFASHFADVSAQGGFDLIIGNPPWVRTHQLPVAERLALRRDFRSMRDAPWRVGAARAGAGPGFAAQADLAAAFVERSLSLLREQGTLALLVPAKLWRALAGGGVRRLLNDEAHVRTLVDWSDAPALFDAAAYPSLLVATRRSADDDTPPRATALDRTPVQVEVVRADRHHRFVLPALGLSLGGDRAAPWLLLPPDVRAAFERLRRAGPSLGDAGLGRPTLGVKCGCNDAFLVHAHEDDDDLARISAGEKRGTVERLLLRPALAGHAVGRTPRDHEDVRILWTHGRDGKPLTTLPPRAARWMQHWRPRLERRRDAQRTQPWWTLFRTDAARPDTPRLVWADFGRTLRTRVLERGDPTVPLNTCYVMRTPTLDDAFALDALLASPLAGAWLDAIAEPARGGWRRFLGWTVAALPVPDDWVRARSLLAPLGRRRAIGDPPSPDEHLAVVASAYRLDPHTVAPLVAWQHA
jgi:hypothetical protein